jgi:hypothetical protein
MYIESICTAEIVAYKFAREPMASDSPTVVNGGPMVRSKGFDEFVL